MKKIFKEVKNEISKVKWPTKKKMLKDSTTVILFVLFFALFFAALDLVIALFKTLGA